MLGHITINQILSKLEKIEKTLHEGAQLFKNDSENNDTYFLSLATNKSESYIITKFIQKIGFGQKDKHKILVFFHEEKNHFGFVKVHQKVIDLKQQNEAESTFRNFIFNQMKRHGNYYELSAIKQIIYKQNASVMTIKFIDRQLQIDFQKSSLALQWNKCLKKAEQKIVKQARFGYDPQQNQKTIEIQHPSKEIFFQTCIIQEFQHFASLLKSLDLGQQFMEQLVKIDNPNDLINFLITKLKEYKQKYKQISLIHSTFHLRQQQLQKQVCFKRQQIVKIQKFVINECINSHNPIDPIPQIQHKNQSQVNKQFIQDSQSNQNQLKKQCLQLQSLVSQILIQPDQSILQIINQSKIENQQREHKILKMEQQIKQYKKIVSAQELLISKTKALQDSQYLHIFQGEVLKHRLQEKYFLRQEIQKLVHKKMKITNLLYRFDPLNSVNYHKYFDQHQNICLVIKLKNQNLIAGYSINPVSNKTVATESGLCLSLTNKKSFKLLEGKRSVTYDNYFLIFGNSQLRIKHGQLKFFTNFGIANSFFDSEGFKYTILTGQESAREELVQTYEIYQVLYQ